VDDAAATKTQASTISAVVTLPNAINKHHQRVEDHRQFELVAEIARDARDVPAVRRARARNMRIRFALATARVRAAASARASARPAG